MAADSALSFVVDRLGQLLSDEVALLRGVHDEVEWVRDQLEWMKSFLQDAYAKGRHGDQSAKRWERAVRDASYHAEDIIESYMVKIIRRRQSVRCCWILKPVEMCARELKPRHKLGVEIKKLKAKINQIKENVTTYGLVQSAPNSATYTTLHRQRITFPQHSDNVVVGFDDHKREILQDLLNTGITRRSVKSIVGMGGLGKTTLARMVFNSNEIKSSFDARAWVCVSQNYTPVDLFKNIGEQIAGTEFQGLGESVLREKIYQFLHGKRYFIILDDVWSVEDWKLLEGVFPDNGNGSRVLITTRFETVASSADPRTNPYHLPHLGEVESWQLFLRTAFPYEHGTEQKICPKDFEDVAKSLVKRCNYLPLALVVLGGIMVTKKRAIEWKDVAEKMEWASDGENCLNILALSCNDLPDNLSRSCFQYLAIFPENMIIKASQVIELWIAEGFITPQGNHIMEDTAEKYLKEFALRSMIQVIKVGFDESVKSFRVHDLFRELCLKEAREGGLFDVCGTSTDLVRIADKNPIRLAIQNMEHICLPPDLRSLSIFHGSVETWEPIDSSKKLRVLNVDNLEEILSLKGMYFLRYLRIANLTSELPSMEDLCNLQTLDVSNCLNSRFPDELGKIRTLRHIHGAYRCLLPPNIGRLKSLRTLDSFLARGGWIEQSLAELSELRKLCITEVETTQENVLADALQKLQHLSCLKLSGALSLEFIRVLSSNDCLFELKLSGKAREPKLPDTSEFPRYLTVLELHKTELEEDPMTTLELLPNLASLTLGENSYVGNEMVCNSGGFLRLEALVLTGLDTLTSWRVAEGAMPKLSYVSIGGCRSFTNDLPMGLQNLLPAGCFVAGPFTSIIYPLEFRRWIEEDHGTDLWVLASCDVKLLLKRHEDRLKQRQEDLLKQKEDLLKWKEDLPKRRWEDLLERWKDLLERQEDLLERKKDLLKRRLEDLPEPRQEDLLERQEEDLLERLQEDLLERQEDLVERLEERRQEDLLEQREDLLERLKDLLEPRHEDLLEQLKDLLEPRQEDLLEQQEDLLERMKDLLERKEDLLEPRQEDLLEPRQEDLLEPRQEDLLDWQEGLLPEDLLKRKEDNLKLQKDLLKRDEDLFKRRPEDLLKQKEELLLKGEGLAAETSYFRETRYPTNRK